MMRAGRPSRSSSRLPFRFERLYEEIVTSSISGSLTERLDVASTSLKESKRVYCSYTVPSEPTKSL